MSDMILGDRADNLITEISSAINRFYLMYYVRPSIIVVPWYREDKAQTLTTALGLPVYYSPKAEKVDVF